MTGQPVAPLVAATACPHFTTAQTYRFVSIPGAMSTAGGTTPTWGWNPSADTAYGSVDISTSGSTVMFKNIKQYTLPSVGGAGIPAFQQFERNRRMRINVCGERDCTFRPITKHNSLIQQSGIRHRHPSASDRVACWWKITDRPSTQRYSLLQPCMRTPWEPAQAPLDCPSRRALWTQARLLALSTKGLFITVDISATMRQPAGPRILRPSVLPAHL